MSIDEHIGTKLRQMRVERGVSPKKLAIILSISEERYSAFEAGEVSIPARLLIDLSVQLDVTVRSFIDGYDVDEHHDDSSRRSTEH